MENSDQQEQCELEDFSESTEDTDPPVCLYDLYALSVSSIIYIFVFAYKFFIFGLFLSYFSSDTLVILIWASNIQFIPAKVNAIQPNL